MATTASQLAAPPSRFVWSVAAPSLVASLALLAIASLAAVSLITNRNESDHVLDDATAALQASADGEVILQQLHSRLTHFGVTGDDSDLAALSDLRTAPIVLQLRNRGSSWRDVQELLDSMEPELRELAQVNAGQRRARAEQIVDRFLGADFVARAHERRVIAAAALESAKERSRELTQWGLWMVMLLGIAGAGAGALAGFALARSLRQRLIELSVPIRTAAGSLDAVVGPVQVRGGGDDVEDLEESLNTLSGRVEEAVQRLQTAQRETLRHDQLAALGQLAAGLAHELRNPLTAIRTLVEVARQRSPSALLDGRDLEVVDEELTRLDATLQSFLDYARPPKLERRNIDLRDIVRRTVQLVTPRADQQAVKLNVTLPAEPLSINADAEQLRQVLLNLLLNALDALGRGGQVAVTARKDAAAGDLVLEVADNGPGIPESVRSTLFDPFVSSKPSGTGLGLTICRRIVENHGGTITAHNAPAGGAVFTIRLPLGQ